MLRLLPENHDRAAAVLEIVVQETRRVGLGSNRSALLRVAQAVHELWELKDTDDDLGKAPRSGAVRRSPSGDCCVDHPVPQSYLAEKLLSLGKEDHRVPYISNLLHQYGFFCLITPEEKDRLVDAGLAETMPAKWNRIDRYARYSEVGIRMGDDRIYSRDEFQRLLSGPAAEFYVYRLRTPANKVFYIGKGEQLRALSHEKELYRKCFRTHTNWKKLNKIAQVLRAGKSIGYELESWHVDETQAFLREDELIVMAERANPWILCNSNGRRWAGKPNRHLVALRAEHGLEN